MDLEVHNGLNPRLAAHIWLLHHLFLDAINRDAQEWAAAWNSHHLQIRGERSRSPHDMFTFSMLTDGPRGLLRRTQPVEEDVEDASTYGIDWVVADDPALMNHLLTENPQDWSDRNPFAPGLETLSQVACEPPNSPFDLVRIAALDAALAAELDLTSRSMHVRHLVWIRALEICHDMSS